MFFLKKKKLNKSKFEWIADFITVQFLLYVHIVLHAFNFQPTHLLQFKMNHECARKEHPTVTN